MVKKIIIFILALFVLINAASAVDSSNWTSATVGYQEFVIPPEYENPHQSDFNMYEYGEDIDEFTIRYVNPRIMSLYGYFIETSNYKKVNVAGHDAVHFTSHDRFDDADNSKLWFSAGDDFYYIAWRGTEITPEIEEIVENTNASNYSHDEFYSTLDREYKDYQLIKSVESQSPSYPTSNNRPHSFVSFGNGGVNFGIIG